MDYQKIHGSIINRAKTRVIDSYVESHHILPKCLGGTDDKDNLVNLTPEEHYIIHQLLVKLHPDNYSLVFAAQKMCQGRANNKLYGWLRRRVAQAVSKLQSGNGNSQAKTFWITNGIQNVKCKGEIPVGWTKGRSYPPNITQPLSYCRKCNDERKRITAQLEARRLYNDFLESGCKTASEYVRDGHYPYSVVSLTQKWKQYIPEYRPNTGRGNKMDH